MKKLSIQSLLCIFVTMTGSAMADQRQCQEAKAKGLKTVDGYYDDRITQADAAVKDIRDKGGDPNNVKIKVGDQWLTIPEISEKLKRDKSLAATYVNDEIDKCEKDLKPLQDIVDGWLVIQTGGLSKILPGKMGHVDVSDILAGYPLGGPDALIPKARDQIFNTLGIKGDVRKVLENPLGGPCSVVRNPFGKGC